MGVRLVAASCCIVEPIRLLWAKPFTTCCWYLTPIERPTGGSPGCTYIAVLCDRLLKEGLIQQENRFL